MYYVVDLELFPGVPEEVALAQRARMADLTKEGTVLLTGPFADGTGGMVILHVPSLEEAKALYSSLPLAQSGMITWSIREWDARAGALVSHLPKGWSP
jgi:uncharacterized protein